QVERRPPDLVRSLEDGELLIRFARSEHARVAAPIVLEIVDTPARERSKILDLVVPARGEALTRRGSGAGVDPELEPLAVDVVAQRLHVGELLVREHRAVARAYGSFEQRIGLAPASFPAVVEVDVCPTVVDESLRHHGIGGRTGE